MFTLLHIRELYLGVKEKDRQVVTDQKKQMHRLFRLFCRVQNDSGFAQYSEKMNFPAPWPEMVQLQ